MIGHLSREVLHGKFFAQVIGFERLPFQKLIRDEPVGDLASHGVS
jgi:hypothetical protein